MIFVHELGHFIAAKLMGVYAPRFSIGFGPSLFKKRCGETEYVLAALPLGGYVRMASREDEATAFLEGGSENSAVDAREIRRDGFDPDAMIPFGPKPIPEIALVRVQVAPGATLHHARGRDDERAPCVRDLRRPAASLGHSVARARRRRRESRQARGARGNSGRRQHRLAERAAARQLADSARQHRRIAWPAAPARNRQARTGRSTVVRDSGLAEGPS